MVLKPTKEEWKTIVADLFGPEQAQDSSISQLGAFQTHYCNVVCPAAASGDAILDFDTPAIQAHEDVSRCLGAIALDPSLTFDAFASHALGDNLTKAAESEKRYVARLVTRAAYTVDCAPWVYDASQTPKWEGDQSFLDFIQGKFPMGDSQSSLWDRCNFESKIKAWKLVSRLGITIEATNDLSEHLMLDQKSMTLKVFHHISFLWAHLKKSLDASLELGFKDSLKSGTLPPRLLLETLASFHQIFFPITVVGEQRSLKLLKTLIRRQGFDPNGLISHSPRPFPWDMTYQYWGDRLTTLCNVVQKRPPRNKVVAWIGRHTTDRDALIVAILGLFLAALFGFLSFIVGLLQLILACIEFNAKKDS